MGHPESLSPACCGCPFPLQKSIKARRLGLEGFAPIAVIQKDMEGMCRLGAEIGWHEVTWFHLSEREKKRTVRSDCESAAFSKPSFLCRIQESRKSNVW